MTGVRVVVEQSRPTEQTPTARSLLLAMHNDEGENNEEIVRKCELCGCFMMNG